ncbi:MAG: hypothetical protein HYY06_13390 [Deltaproteobacteria bacterium]|nr:hypothetical protein [Deltaproteobacteria bacterium]
MGLLGDKLVGEHDGHRFEVRADNQILRGLTYSVFVDGQEIGDAQNFLKIPTERRIEADVELDGARRKLVLLVKQQMLRTDFELTLDGAEVSLTAIR